jgi:hypothetical protein
VCVHTHARTYGRYTQRLESLFYFSFEMSAFDLIVILRSYMDDNIGMDIHELGYERSWAGLT